MKHILKLSATLLAASSSLAFAEDFATSSIVAEVDLYPDGVIVERQAEFSVPAGSHTLVLENLPLDWDPRTLGVQIAGVEGLELVSFSANMAARNEQAHEEQQKLYAQANAITTQIENLNQQVGTLRLEKQLVDKFIADPTLFSERDDAVEFWAYLIERDTTIAPEIHAAEDEINALTAERSTLAGQARTLDSALVTRQVRLSVDAPRAGNVIIETSYFSSNAYWRPSYKVEMEAEEDKPRAGVQVTQEAEIWQFTGENWEGAEARLHSSLATAQLSVPSAWTQNVDQNGFSSRGGLLGYANDRSIALEEEGRLEMADMAVGAQLLSQSNITTPVEPLQAALVSGGFSSVYALPRALDQISDQSQSQTVVLETQSTQGDVWVQTVAAQDARATLMVGFDSPLSAAALPGYAKFYRDGSFVGRANLAAMQPGESLELPFGIDPLVTVVRDVIHDEEGGSGFIGRRETHAKTIQTKVTNAHDFAMPVRLIEATPVSRHEDITVQFFDTTSPFDVEDLLSQEGVVRWDLLVDPEQQLIRTLDYEISWPREMSVNIF